MSKKKSVKVQVIPKSGKAGKPQSVKLAAGETAAHACGVLGISLVGKKLTFAGKPIAAGDVVFAEGARLPKGAVLRVEEHAQGS
jgi:hypothetical protein